jgi:hypothetical protein
MTFRTKRHRADCRQGFSEQARILRLQIADHQFPVVASDASLLDGAATIDLTGPWCLYKIRLGCASRLELPSTNTLVVAG